MNSVIINGTISDRDPNSKVTLYYTVDDGTENNLNEQALVDNKLDFMVK